MPDADPSLVTEALDALQEGVQLLSPSWRYLYVNQAAARQGRKPREELLGKTMMECYPGIEASPMFAALERCMRDRRSDALENEFVYEDGKRAWFELRVRPCPSGVAIISLDMTERKNVESRLKEAYGQALRDLVTPVIRVHDGILLVPLVGTFDSEREARVTETVLTRAADEHAKVVIFDVAGVPTLDTAGVHHLLQTTAMIRLLGGTTILTGMRAAMARAIVHLGADISTMETTSQLSEGIELALALVAKKP